jgi:hypothetical protein
LNGEACLSIALNISKRKDYQIGSLSGGPERIRTAVEAFAELCLATRPQDHFTGGKNSANKVILKF